MIFIKYNFALFTFSDSGGNLNCKNRVFVKSFQHDSKTFSPAIQVDRRFISSCNKVLELLIQYFLIGFVFTIIVFEVLFRVTR